MADCSRKGDFFASQDIEEGKKYGGLAKKKPLISKEHERAFFDSADWALCKLKVFVGTFGLGSFMQGAGMNQKSTVAIETLQPKLQKTPHQQLPPRRPTCTSGTPAQS